MSMRNYSDDYYRTNASELTEQLYLAACKGVTSKCLLELGITSIINATLELPTVAYQKQETMQIAVEDRVASKLNIYFDLVADRIHQVHSTGGKILVYCRAGQSRSATLCIAYFMKYHSMTYDQAFQYVRRCRPIIHPNIGFVRQLKEFEKKLASKSDTSGSPTFKKIKSDAFSASISYADECILDETEFVSHELIPLKPFKPRPRRPLPVLHEPTYCLADHFDAVPILQCTILPAACQHPIENSAVKIQDPRPVVSSTLPSNTIGQLGELPDNSANGRAKRKTAFTRLTRPNDIASFQSCTKLMRSLKKSLMNVSGILPHSRPKL